MMRDRDARKPRIAEPQRRQGVIRFEMPEDALPASHRARVLWEVVGTLELGKFLRGARAIEGTAGRKTLSPRMKLVLWLYAISMGVGSAREIARLVRSDDAYRWIAFDLKVGHDTLSSFRVEHGAALDELMTDILASLTHKGVLSLDLVAQDGTASELRRRRRRFGDCRHCSNAASKRRCSSRRFSRRPTTRNSRVRSTRRAWQRRPISSAASRRRSLPSSSCSRVASRQTSRCVPRRRTPKRV